MSKAKKPAKTQVRKPRASEVRVDFGREQVLSGMNLADDGTLTFFGEKGEVVEPVSIEVGSAYARPKGPKVIGRQPSQPSRIQKKVAGILGIPLRTSELDEKD